MQDQQEPRPGQQVSEYRLVRKLGGGGFGTVYQAEHVQKHTQVAVKVLALRLTGREDFKGFINEARTIRLRHPHIVPLLDFGISQDDLPFLVMEYAPEGTLRDRHPKGERIPLPIVVSYVDQLASALQYAHDHRVIHRDVKPENILVRADGTLLVSDFGIAKILEQSVLISQQTQVGTPVYMAPEQSTGHPCFASDQYALAVMIYEWICGVRPFRGTAIGLAVQHMNIPPPPLRDHLPELSESIERVIFKALAKVPEDRFQHIQAFAEALREVVSLSSTPIEAGDVAPITPAQHVSQSAAHQSSTQGLHSFPSEILPLAKSPPPQKRRPQRTSLWLGGGAFGLLLLIGLLALTIKPIISQLSAIPEKQFIGKNLMVNGNAESSPGSHDGNAVSPIPGWTPSGNFTVMAYNASSAIDLSIDPRPFHGGENFFAGGPDNQSSGADQVIDVSPVSTSLDTGKTHFMLSAYLGGFGNQDDHAQLSVQFQGSNGQVLKTVSLPVVLATDRNNQTAFLQKTTSGLVPSGTRKVKVALVMIRAEGSYNDGYADNLSLIFQ